MTGRSISSIIDTPMRRVRKPSDPRMTPAQAKVWNSIREYVAENQLPPTIREICERTGLSSSSTVWSHLRQLERKGYLSAGQGGPKGAPRSIRLIQRIDWRQVADLLERWAAQYPANPLATETADMLAKLRAS